MSLLGLVMLLIVPADKRRECCLTLSQAADVFAAITIWRVTQGDDE
jgi:hypothetical protein